MPLWVCLFFTIIVLDVNEKMKKRMRTKKNFFRVFLMKRGLFQPFLLFLHENVLLN